MNCEVLGNEEMKHLKVEIPRISNNNNSTPPTHDDELSRVYWEDNSVTSPQAKGKKPIVSLPELYTTDHSAPVLWIEDLNKDAGVGKTRDNYYEECFRIFNEVNSASVRLPCMKPGELKGGVPVVRVNGEVIRVRKETKEQIEKDLAEAYRFFRINKRNPKICPEKQFNSSSTFIEKEEKLIDRAYFYVLNKETYAENEICLDGVFVEDF